MTASDALLTIRGKRTGLGPIRRDLLDTYARWVNDFSMMRTKDDPPIPMPVDRYIEVVEGAGTGDDHVWFTIYILANDDSSTPRPIGIAGLFDIDHRHGTAEFAIHIGETIERGRGYGAETTRLVLDYAFTQINLHNIVLRAFADNLAGLRAYEKAGFRRIGTRRHAWRMGATLRDVVHMECVHPIRWPVDQAS